MCKMCVTSFLTVSRVSLFLAIDVERIEMYSETSLLEREMASRQ